MPVDPGQRQVLGGLPSSAPLTVQLPLPLCG